MEFITINYIKFILSGISLKYFVILISVWLLLQSTQIKEIAAEGSPGMLKNIYSTIDQARGLICTLMVVNAAFDIPHIGINAYKDLTNIGTGFVGAYEITYKIKNAAMVGVAEIYAFSKICGKI